MIDTSVSKENPTCGAGNITKSKSSAKVIGGPPQAGKYTIKWKKNIEIVFLFR